MHPRIIRAIARKDALDLLLNKQTLFMLLTPIFLAIFFLVIGTLLGGQTTDILVYNPDYTPGHPGVEQVLTSSFSDARIVRANSPEDVAAAFGPDGAHTSSSYALGLVVPAGFEARLRAGDHPAVQLYINGDNVSPQQQQLLESALMGYSQNIVNPSPIALRTTTINPASGDNPLKSIAGFYALGALLSSFLIGSALAPGLLIEEKEKKTLRLLMVSPASWADVISAKLLVALGYQLILALVALAITKGYIGQIPLLILFVILGSCFSVALGALAGSIFKTQGASGAFSGVVSFIYIIPIFFVGPQGQAFINGGATQVVKALPTYWLADGAAKALQSQATLENLALDLVIVIGASLLLFLLAVWWLRRQASVVSTI